MKELISAFNNHASSQPDRDVQTCIYFDSPPELVFVKNLQTLTLKPNDEGEYKRETKTL